MNHMLSWAHREHVFGLWKPVYEPITQFSLIAGDLIRQPRILCMRICQVCGFVETKSL